MIILVRHGRTEANAAGRLLGRADPPLDELGRAQVGRVAASLGQPDRVVSSPLLRCRQTADALGVGIEVEVDERFVELDYGDWDGRAVAEVSAGEWARWRSDLDLAPPGGESLSSLGRRVRGGLDELASDPRAEGAALTVVVTHVSPIKAAVAWALGVGDEIAWRCFVAPGSVTEIAVTAGTPSLRGFNLLPTE